MRRLRLPDLIIPETWVDCRWRQDLQVEIRIRDRKRRNIVCGSHTTSTHVTVASLDEALAAAIPLLIGKINLRTSGQMIWDADARLPPDPPQNTIPRPLLRVRRRPGRPWPKPRGPWDDVWSPWDDLVVD